MPWVQIALLIFRFLQQVKRAESAEALVASTGAVGANGDILRFFWEHREEIIALVMKLFNSNQGNSTVGATDDPAAAEVSALIEELKS